MIPIQDVLHRIRWDPGFGSAAVEIGYVDRVAGGIVRVPFRDLRLGGGRRPALRIVAEDGSVRTIPLHRVRQVWRDGQLVWQRASPSTQVG